MTKRERLTAACAGQPVDRVPFSLWYHFRLDPPAGEGMAKAELDFYHRYSPDLFKVMHDIPYEMPEGMPEARTPEEWRKLPVLDGVSGNFGAQLDTVKRIVAGRGDDGPVIDTVFSIFSTAEKVSGKRTLELLRSDPDAAHVGFRALAASLANYARALTFAADGIYLAISGCASDTMDASEYRENFLGYDQQILDAAAPAPFNVVHHHGAGIYADMVLGLKGYRIYSWSDRLPGNPGVREMRLRTQACLMTGVDETTFGTCDAGDVARQVRETVAATNGRGMIAAPGCAVPTPPDSSDACLRAFALGVGA